MGQPITVVEKPSASNPAVLRLETNRPLSGMGHERYAEAPPEILDRPVDEVARRLFAAGGVETVHINGSVITVTLGGGRTGAGLADVVRRLFLHYGDQPVEPVPGPTDEPERAPEALADTAEEPAAEAAEEPAAEAAEEPAAEAAEEPAAEAAEEPAAEAAEEPAAEAAEEPAAEAAEEPAAEAAEEPAAADPPADD